MKACLLGALCLPPGGNLRARRQIQLLEDVADVVLHGALREEELLGDLSVGEAARQQVRNTLLAAGELRRRFAGRRSLRRMRRWRGGPLFRYGVLADPFWGHAPPIRPCGF